MGRNLGLCALKVARAPSGIGNTRKIRIFLIYKYIHKLSDMNYESSDMKEINTPLMEPALLQH